MTEITLKKLIVELNNRRADDHIFIQPLTTSVDFAKVWTRPVQFPSKKKILFGPNSFYFFKNEEGMYVGTVSDMNTDLHWYILPKYRGKGYLTNALITTILPHLFQDDREEQRITIERNAIGQRNFTASLRVAENVGFVKISDQDRAVEMKVKREKFENTSVIEGKPMGLTEKRAKELKAKARELWKELVKIESELEIKLGFTDEIEEIMEIANGVHKVESLVDSTYWTQDPRKRMECEG